MIEFFGRTAKGEEVHRLTLRDGDCACEVITYGGAVRSLLVPDRGGNPTDVVLGFDTIADYETQDKFIGALIGRFGNRIGGAKFALNGKEYALFCNDGPNTLHGGKAGFDKRVWAVESLTANAVTLLLHSADGEEGYPGALTVRVTYTLERGALSIRYEAESDADTPCNLTNHTYFNLAGHGSGPVLGQEICLHAGRYTPTDAGSIPTGALDDVAGTPMDLRALTPIGAHISDDFAQLGLAGGYDHNWAIDGAAGTLRPAAQARSSQTGITLAVETTLPGVQFYTGNYLDGCPAGKNAAPYARRWGFCLETQFFPDSPNRPEFPRPILRRGEIYDHTTVYRFGTT